MLSAACVRKLLCLMVSGGYVDSRASWIWV
jgi:hypothetical protein